MNTPTLREMLVFAKPGLALRAMILTALIANTTSCGQKNDDDKDSNAPAPELRLSPFEQLTGEWAGIYRELEDGKPKGEASGVTVQFQPDGAFSVSLDDIPSARVEGTWNEFQGKSLILRISGSSIPRVGASGKVVEPGYELYGTSLRISQELFEMKLTKMGSSSGGTNPNGSGASTLTGSWICDDRAGRKTKIFISEDSEFRLSSVRSGERVFVARGKMTILDGAAASLVPTSTSDPLPEDSRFEIRQAGAQADLSMHRSNQSVTNLGRCRK